MAKQIGEYFAKLTQNNPSIRAEMSWQPPKIALGSAGSGYSSIGKNINDLLGNGLKLLGNLRDKEAAEAARAAAKARKEAANSIPAVDMPELTDEAMLQFSDVGDTGVVHNFWSGVNINTSPTTSPEDAAQRSANEFVGLANGIKNGEFSIEPYNGSKLLGLANGVNRKTSKEVEEKTGLKYEHANLVDMVESALRMLPYEHGGISDEGIAEIRRVATTRTGTINFGTPKSNEIGVGAFSPKLDAYRQQTAELYDSIRRAAVTPTQRRNMLIRAANERAAGEQRIASEAQQLANQTADLQFEKTVERQKFRALDAIRGNEDVVQSLPHIDPETGKMVKSDVTMTVNSDRPDVFFEALENIRTLVDGKFMFGAGGQLTTAQQRAALLKQYSEPLITQVVNRYLTDGNLPAAGGLLSSAVQGGYMGKKSADAITKSIVAQQEKNQIAVLAQLDERESNQIIAVNNPNDPEKVKETIKKVNDQRTLNENLAFIKNAQEGTQFLDTIVASAINQSMQNAPVVGLPLAGLSDEQRAMNDYVIQRINGIIKLDPEEGGYNLTVLQAMGDRIRDMELHELLAQTNVDDWAEVTKMYRDAQGSRIATKTKDKDTLKKEHIADYIMGWSGDDDALQAMGYISDKAPQEFIREFKTYVAAARTAEGADYDVNEADIRGLYEQFSAGKIKEYLDSRLSEPIKRDRRFSLNPFRAEAYNWFIHEDYSASEADRQNLLDDYLDAVKRGEGDDFLNSILEFKSNTLTKDELKAYLGRLNRARGKK